MLGREFTRVLRSAQAGDERAFAQLFRDANPVMIRYLRVVGVDDPYDAACEGWITVVRGLPGFKGDETAWRVWLLACARMRAEEGSLRRSWKPSGAAPPEAATDDLLVDSLDDSLDGSEQDTAHRGVKDTIAAIRELPLGQGEIVMLRLAAELPVGAVADIIGADAAAVRRGEARGIERLGADRDLLMWSLAAPAMPAELADERVALGAFRSMPKSARGTGAPRAATILTLGTATERRPRRVELADAQVVSIDHPLTRDSRRAKVRRVPHDGRAGATVTPLPAPTRAARRAAARSAAGATSGRRSAAPTAGLVAGHSRAAIIGIVAASASVMSLSGISAAAFVGVLPEGPQQALHELIGAPAPHRSSADGGDGLGSLPGGTPVGPAATSSAARGLCQAWASDKAKGTAPDRSIAFRNLAAAAGDASKVDAYCRVATTPTPTKTVNPPRPTAKPTPSSTEPSTTKTPPAKTPPTKASPTRTPNAHVPTSKAANPNSPTKTSKTASSTSPGGGSGGSVGKGSQDTATQGSTQPSAAVQSTPDVASTAPSSLDSVARAGKAARGAVSSSR